MNWLEGIQLKRKQTEMEKIITKLFKIGDARLPK